MSEENWRVVREWSDIGEAGCLYFFRLEDIYEPRDHGYSPRHPNAHPFVDHQGGPLQIMGDTPHRLRQRLKAMLAALDEPVLEWTPRRLIELPKEQK